jgi:hypothetical protein
MNSIEKELKIFKGISSLILVWVLINPITIYLLCDNIFFSIFFPVSALILLSLIRTKSIISRIKVYYFNLLFLISIIYHAELIFTINFSEQNMPNLYKIKGNYYFNKPNLVENFYDNEYHSIYLTNKQGFRIDENENAEKEILNCDWLFLGDSYTQGAQVNYSDLFTTKVYHYFPNKIILNAGISGYSIVDEYNYYISEGYKLHPQKVFLQICIFNDFMNVIENKAGITEYMMQYSNLYRYLFYNLQYANSIESPLGRWTEPFYPTEQGNENYNIFYKGSSEKKEKDIANFILYLSKFKEAITKTDSELCVILIPTKEQISFAYFSQVVDSFKIDISQLDMYYPNTLMDSLSKEYQFELIDLYDDFSNGQGFPFFEKDEHLNSIGHQKTANAIKNKYLSESLSYQYFSKKNTGARYPTLCGDRISILYQSLEFGVFQIFESDTLFESQKQLTDTYVDKIHPSLSEDKGLLLYTQGDQNKGETKIVLQNQISKDLIYITDSGEYGAIPNFSKSGKLVAYTSWWNFGGKLSNPVIMLYDIQTHKKKSITEDIYESWRPVFHPNDSIIYYLSKEYQENFVIESYNLNSNKKSLILKTDYNIWDIAISPDGCWMVYAGYKNENWDLFLLNINTGDIKQITETLGDEWDPNFGSENHIIWFSGNFGTNNGIYKLIWQ